MVSGCDGQHTAAVTAPDRPGREAGGLVTVHGVHKVSAGKVEVASVRPEPLAGVPVRVLQLSIYLSSQLES